MNKVLKDFTLDPQASLTKCDRYRNANEESCPLRSFSTSRKQLFLIKRRLSWATYFHSSNE